MKILRLLLLSAVCSGCLATVQAQPARDVTEQVRVFSAPVVSGPAAVAVTTKGKVQVSQDGKHFAALQPKQILTEGMTVKTGGDGQAEIYFRRTGVSLWLREKSELKLTEMDETSKEGKVITTTALDLQRGRALASTIGPLKAPFEIKSAKGLKVAPTKVDGRHVITAGSARGTKSIDLANMPAMAQGSAAPREKGKKHSRDEAISGYREIDELKSLSEEWSREPKEAVKQD